MKQKKEAPKHWSGMPGWIRENDWLIENQDSMFAKRLIHTVVQIQSDKAIRKPGQAPMVATIGCLLGIEAAEATRFQYSAAIKLMAVMSGTDLQNAQEIFAKFREDFGEYIKYLEN